MIKWFTVTSIKALNIGLLWKYSTSHSQTDLSTNHLWARPGGGGGERVLSLEKGTDYGLTAVKLWLSRANVAKNGGCPVIIKVDMRAGNFFCINILH